MSRQEHKFSKVAAKCIYHISGEAPPITTDLTLIAVVTGLIFFLGTLLIIRSKKIVVTDEKLTFNRLPKSFDGFRIVLFSDLHLGFFCTPKYLDSLKSLINSLTPDAICFAGDFTDKRTIINRLKEVSPILQEFEAPYGKYAVLGNHDCLSGKFDITNALEAGGFQVLTNKGIVIEKNNEKIYICGLDDAIEGNAAPDEALSFAEADVFTIMMIHEPDFADQISRNKVDLQISGHSHGGQVCLPLIGPLRTTYMGKKYLHGLYNVSEMQLYTTRGVGTTILPIRFFCPPEVVLLELVSAKSIP